MLSLFPDILFLAPVSAFIIRIALAVAMGYAAWKHFAAPENGLRASAVLEAAVAAALVAGIWTQAAALAGFVVASLAVIFPRLKTLPLSTTLLSLVMFLSLLVTGAGAFAFDLPL